MVHQWFSKTDPCWKHSTTMTHFDAVGKNLSGVATVKILIMLLRGVQI